jgi:inorganic pyrophosphatase
MAFNEYRIEDIQDIQDIQARIRKETTNGKEVQRQEDKKAQTREGWQEVTNSGRELQRCVNGDINYEPLLPAQGLAN